MIVTLLVLLWGLRLSYHILVRNSGKGEDFRYKAWRNTWNYFLVRSYFQIFMLQGVLMLLISAPVWFINSSTGGPLGLWDSVGLIVFGAGFFFEVIADYQLAEFKRNPENKGKIITTGLWSVSRHPNYFGESLVWWGLSFYAFSLHNGWFTLISPLIITLLLRFVSGVPMLEKKYENHPDWKAYKAKTAAFIPFVKFL
jgi:steroid 5-alpha reductase family enzyme